MGKHTPQMNASELKAYLGKHLDNELQWLLRAATEWHVQNKIKLNIDGYQVQVYAMDSAFLHARTLFEFFTRPTSDNYYGCDAFGIQVIDSPRYRRDWVGPLHAHLMHAQDRSKPRQLQSFDGSCTKDLNCMVVDFAKEIVRLWHEFENSFGRHRDPQIIALQQDARSILEDATNNAGRVLVNEMVRQYNVKPIVW